MTDQERQELKIGDHVLVRDDDGNEADYTVRSEPWRLGDGEWVIGLSGIIGGYKLSRVVRKLEDESQRMARYIAELMRLEKLASNAYMATNDRDAAEYQDTRSLTFKECADYLEAEEKKRLEGK